MLLDAHAEDDHWQGNEATDGGLWAVETALDGALKLVEEYGQGGDTGLGESQGQEELAPVQDKNDRKVTTMPEATSGRTMRRRV